MVRLTEDALIIYSESKEEYDERLSEAVQFDYDIADEFETSGNKIPANFEKTAIFVDCAFVGNDIHAIVTQLSVLLEEFSGLIYMMIFTEEF